MLEKQKASRENLLTAYFVGVKRFCIVFMKLRSLFVKRYATC